MKVCSITGIPFYDHSEIMVIPVIVREKKVLQCIANDNVHPLPIAFAAQYRLNDVYPIEDERFEKALSFISSLANKETSWVDFEMFEVNQKLIKYGNYDYSFGLFLCHKYAFDNVIQNFKIQMSYTKEPEQFQDYKESLKLSIQNNGIYQMACTLLNPVPYVERLPVTIVSDYAMPENFTESDLDSYCEIRMINSFLNNTGKQWIVSVDAPEEKHSLAMSILIDSIHTIAISK